MLSGAKQGPNLRNRLNLRGKNGKDRKSINLTRDGERHWVMEGLFAARCNGLDGTRPPPPHPPGASSAVHRRPFHVANASCGGGEADIGPPSYRCYTSCPHLHPTRTLAPTVSLP